MGTENVQPRPRSGTARMILIAVLVVGIVATGVIVALTAADALRPPEPTPMVEGVTVIEPPVDLPDFTLTNQAGEPVSLSDLQGNLTLLFFGYTHCPDYCPLTLDEYKRVRQELGDDAEQINFVFISVDGERDTPELLDNYLEVRGVEDFVTALTGPEEEVREIGQPYGLFFETNPGTQGEEYYLVDHSTLSYLIDRDGNLRALYSFTTTPDVIAESIRGYL